MNIPMDAFSHGQIDSKQWLVQELLRKDAYWYTGLSPKDQFVWVFGGWIGVLPFLLLTSKYGARMQIRSFDIDPDCQPIADKINNAWEYNKWQFKAFTADVNQLDYTIYGGVPTMIINTSVEHFDSDEWFAGIPDGMLVVLQASNMEHEDHRPMDTSIAALSERFPLNLDYSGYRTYRYPDKSFRRTMLIGTK